jgi:hypothetical protein
LNNADFRGGSPRQSVDFQKGLEFDEAAFYWRKRFNLFTLAWVERSLFNRYSCLSGLDGFIVKMLPPCSGLTSKKAPNSKIKM